MAQKKLLSILKLMLVFVLFCKAITVSADNDFKVLAENSREIALQHLENILEENTMNDSEKNNRGKASLKKQESEIYVFVSTSMPLALLENYYREASIYNATLVFNGLPDGSFKKLGELIQKLYESSGKKEVAAIIDDESFKKYGVKNVPSFVRFKEENCFSERGCRVTYDKIYGNIGIKRALEEFMDSGDLRITSKRVLR